MASDPAAPVPPNFRLRERHEVALFDEGDDGHNVIVAGGIDVVVPVELDLDGDPMVDDEVSLRSVHGLWEHTLTIGDPDVRADHDRRLAYYRFRYVPPGVYRVAVRIGADWVQLGSNLTVRTEGVYWNGTKMEASAPNVTASEAEGRVDTLEAGTDHPDEEGKGCGGHHYDEGSDG